MVLSWHSREQSTKIYMKTYSSGLKEENMLPVSKIKVEPQVSHMPGIQQRQESDEYSVIESESAIKQEGNEVGPLQFLLVKSETKGLENQTSNFGDNVNESSELSKKVCNNSYIKCHLDIDLKRESDDYRESDNGSSFADDQCTEKLEEIGEFSENINESFICKVCGQSFIDGTVLGKHVKMHKRCRIFKCEICNRIFPKNFILTEHMNAHNGERPYACKVCSKTFSRKSVLYSHFRIHSGRQPFLCDICNKAFTLKGNLIKHMRLHSGEFILPYACEVCNYKFVDKSRLDRHMLVHSGYKPHICKICQKSFAHKYKLVNHMYTHSSRRTFTCELCNTKFIEKSKLDNHMNRHTGESPFKCDVCSKLYTRRGNLNRHKVSHVKQ